MRPQVGIPMILAFIALASCLYGCASNMPTAMDYETKHQRKVAAKTIKRAPGYYEMNFTQNIK